MGEDPLDLDLRRRRPARKVPDMKRIPHPRAKGIDPSPERGDRRVEIGRAVGRDKVAPLIDFSHADREKSLIIAPIDPLADNFSADVKILREAQPRHLIQPEFKTRQGIVSQDPLSIDLFYKIDREGVLTHYTLTSFELWLNQMSGLSFSENFHIRAKIVGKRIDRSDYQAFFPIGMGKVYEGSHFVTAHRSPDLDTTISSFWGWVDAFGARVGDSLHIWNLPGGPPPSQIEIQWIFSRSEER